MKLCRADKLLLAGGASLLGWAGLSVAGMVSGASLAVPATAFGALLADGLFRPASSMLYPTLTHGPREGHQICLSFDDGPDERITPAVLDLLAQHGARASFFVIGQHLQQHPAIARRIVAEGHELGNHSFTHSRLQNFYVAARQWQEIERCSALIQHLTGSDQEPLYRPPIGLKSPPLARAAQARQLNVVAWSLHSRDTRLADPQKIAERVLRKVRAGDIVLLHDGHDLPARDRPRLLQALPLILQGLAERGLHSVTASELLAARLQQASA